MGDQTGFTWNTNIILVIYNSDKFPKTMATPFGHEFVCTKN